MAGTRTARSFTQYFGAEAVDATALMMPLMLFVSPDRSANAVDDRAGREELVVGQPGATGTNVRRPRATGCRGGRDVQHLHVLAGGGDDAVRQVEEAQFLFEKMLTYANHLGLFSEEIGRTGEALGNFRRRSRIWD